MQTLELNNGVKIPAVGYGTWQSPLLEEFHSRGILVVAEGIERKEEFDYLAGIGIDLFQGYYLARPA